MGIADTDFGLSEVSGLVNNNSFLFISSTTYFFFRKGHGHGFCHL